MRIVLILLISIISFLGTLVGALAITGNFSKESLERLIKGEKTVSSQIPSLNRNTSEEEIISLVERIKKKEEELKKKEAELTKKEQELKNISQQLQEIQNKVESAQNEIAKKFGEDLQDKEKRLQTIAITLAEMKPDKAAERLKTMSPDEIAEILSYVKPKERGKIVEALDAQLASQVLQSLQKVKAEKSTL